MSDVREAFDLGKRFAAAYDAVDEAGMDQIEAEFAALQSQTAPAVPEGLDLELIVNALSDYEQALTNGDLDGAGHHLPSDIELQGHLLSLLAAAPQPDHTGDDKDE